MESLKFHHTRYKDINDTTHVIVVASVDAHLAQTKKGQFHLKLPWRASNFHHTRYKDINDTTHVIVVAPVDVHLAQTKKGQFHLKLPRRSSNFTTHVTKTSMTRLTLSLSPL